MYPAFIELPTFLARWADLGLTDANLKELQLLLGENPQAGDVVSGVSGMRKVRFAPPGAGKSGKYRVYYAHFPGVGVVVLAVVYAKNEVDDIPAKLRKSLATMVREIADELEG